jgi:hypothetical protein
LFTECLLTTFAFAPTVQRLYCRLNISEVIIPCVILRYRYPTPAMIHAAGLHFKWRKDRYPAVQHTNKCSILHRTVINVVRSEKIGQHLVSSSMMLTLHMCYVASLYHIGEIGVEFQPGKFISLLATCLQRCTT